jgi:hypothetical protein
MLPWMWPDARRWIEGRARAFSDIGRGMKPIGAWLPLLHAPAVDSSRRI